VKSGLGIGAIIDEVGDAEPLVERVLPAMPPIPVPMWLVAHREVHTSRRVRAVFDLLAQRLRSPPAPLKRGPTTGRKKRKDATRGARS
jgi:DNA-binding transcriptional LysR family regulator